MSSRYEISAHRFENAAIMVCAWVRKCQYFYGQEVTDASLVDRDFPPAVFAAYEEPSELIKLERRVGKELHARVKQLRDMFHVLLFFQFSDARALPIGEASTAYAVVG